MTISLKLLILSLIISAISLLGWLDFVKFSLNVILSPIKFGVYELAVGAKADLDFVLHIASLKEELRNLSEENLSLKSLQSEVRELTLENTALRDQLGAASDRTNNSMIFVSVEGYVFGSSGTRLILDKGKSSGVVSGMPAVYKDYLVGIVGDVTERSSELKLILDPDVRISVLDENTRARGIVKGNFGTNIIMSDVLNDEKINVGDRIVTSGENPLIPQGLIIGDIKSINSNEQAIFKEAYVRSLVDYKRMEKLFIVKVD